MKKELPARPNVEHLKAQAKDLLEGARRRDPEALARFRDALPAARGLDDEAVSHLKLHDAQSALAREYGFEGFNALREHVEMRAGASPEMMRALMDPHLMLPLPPEILEAARLAATMREAVPPIADRLPLLAIRNAVLTRGAVAPFNIGRPGSRAAVAAAQQADGILGVFAQKDPADEEGRDLHPVGCAARLVTTVETRDRGTWVVVRGVAWVSLRSIEAGFARVTPFVVREDADAEVARMDRKLRAKIDVFAKALPGGEQLARMTAGMSTSELVDVTLANLPCSVAEKAACAAEPTLSSRLARLLALVP